MINLSYACVVYEFWESVVIKKIMCLLVLLVCAACDQKPVEVDVVVQTAEPDTPEHTLIHNAVIYTMDLGYSFADSMVFDNQGEVIFVGNVEPMREKFPNAYEIDLEGKTIIPGLIDAHGHLAGLAVSLANAQLQGTTSKDEIIRKLREHEEGLSADDWLVGGGWDQNDWPVQEFPTREDLDAAFPDRPVYLRRIDGHASWSNSAALATADQDMSGEWQPKGGQIYRDENGEATGILIDGAMDLVGEQVPDISPELFHASMDLALQQMVSLGLTGVHDPGLSREVIEYFQRRIKRDAFPTRVYAMTDGAGETLDWLCEVGPINDPSGRLHMRSVKLYIDGALGSRGAALLSDYSDDPGNSGLLFMPEEELEVMVDKALGCGFQVGIHGIGDRGNRVALDALQSSIQKHPDNPGRHRIEHAQVLTAEDIPRFAEMSVIAAMQPTHATSDMYWADARLGPDRAEFAYAWRSILDSGGRLALGSDFPVELVDPMLGLHAAITRQDSKGWPEGGWNPEQNLTIEEAVRGFTRDAAYAGFMENEVGSLEPGKRADFIVLDRNIFKIEPAEILQTKVLQTWIDGELVYER
jgi:predicted amidohydrolase YtcJ